MHVLLEPERMATRQVSVLEMERALKGANVNLRAGTMDEHNREIVVDAGAFIKSADEVMELLVDCRATSWSTSGTWPDLDGPEEVEGYTRLTFGPGARRDHETAV